jgi:hypothetical protein
MSATLATKPCPHCFESSGYEARIHPATWYEPAWEDTDYSRPCKFCDGTGSIKSERKSPLPRFPPPDPDDDIAF